MGVRFKSRDVENSAERLICIGLVASDRVISQLAPILSPDLFTARYTQIVAEWCLDFYKAFELAPKGHIQDVFESEKRESLDDSVADLIESLLSSLNNQLVEDTSTINEEYILQEAEKYIKMRRAAMLCEDVSALLSRGQVLEAEGRIASYSIPQRPTAQGEDVFSADFWCEDEEEHPVLFKLPGELGKLVGPIERDSFTSLIAVEKTGKTTYLLYFALQAFRQRNNVIFVSTGDMTRTQIRDRLRHMLTFRDPKRKRSTVRVPVMDCWHNQCGDCPIGNETDPIMIGCGRMRSEGTFDDFPEHKPCTLCLHNREDAKEFFGRPWYKEVIVDEVAKELPAACAAIAKQAGHHKFKLLCVPPQTLSIAQLEAHLDVLQHQENFMADVVVLDYADLLDSEPGSKKEDARNRININWMAMRALAQKRRCALITATQAKIEARRKAQVDQWDTSEDKRKLAHVTAMFALNQTPAEKRAGIIRMSCLAMRDREFDTEYNVEILQCPALGKPVLYSYPHKEKPRPRRTQDQESDGE